MAVFRLLTIQPPITKSRPVRGNFVSKSRGFVLSAIVESNLSGWLYPEGPRLFRVSYPRSRVRDEAEAHRGRSTAAFNPYHFAGRTFLARSQHTTLHAAGTPASSSPLYVSSCGKWNRSIVLEGALHATSDSNPCCHLCRAAVFRRPQRSIFAEHTRRTFSQSALIDEQPSGEDGYPDISQFSGAM
jgi:hypothetical protein